MDQIAMNGINRAEILTRVFGGGLNQPRSLRSPRHPNGGGLRKFTPRYIVPTHCTGRKLIQEIEEVMPESFLLNMSGTRLTFAA
jgi:metal-dependent hydrolase (beta-lactamase superfamily II)